LNIDVKKHVKKYGINKYPVLNDCDYKTDLKRPDGNITLKQKEVYQR
jgi:hypothetical protein